MTVLALMTSLSRVTDMKTEDNGELMNNMPGTSEDYEMADVGAARETSEPQPDAGVLDPANDKDVPAVLVSDITGQADVPPEAAEEERTEGADENGAANIEPEPDTAEEADVPPEAAEEESAEGTNEDGATDKEPEPDTAEEAGAPPEAAEEESAEDTDENGTADIEPEPDTAEEADVPPEAAEEERAEETDGDGAAETDQEPNLAEESAPSETAKEDVVGLDNAIQGERYADSHYLLFGYNKDANVLALSDTFEYLKKYKFHENALKQARDKQDEAARIAQSYSPNGADKSLCDFCGCELTGVEHETLRDGRERCNACSRTSVKTLDGFTAIFNDVFKNMSKFYQIKINTSIRIRFASAEKIARKLGYTLKKEAGFMPRAVGVAIKDRDGYSILIENGAPKLSAASTIAHELTHIWQYLNWDEKTIVRTYGKNNKLIVYEGMAKWVEIQYLIFINELAYAKRQEICTLGCQDEYGEGLKRYLAEYPLLSGIGAPVSKTPFKSVDSLPLK
jgi:hypothetical protein